MTIQTHIDRANGIANQLVATLRAAHSCAIDAQESFAEHAILRLIPEAAALSAHVSDLHRAATLAAAVSLVVWKVDYISEHHND